MTEKLHRSTRTVAVLLVLGGGIGLALVAWLPRSGGSTAVDPPRAAARSGEGTGEAAAPLLPEAEPPAPPVAPSPGGPSPPRRSASLDPRILLHGRVVRADGEPAMGASLRLSSGERTLSTAESDPSGAFELLAIGDELAPAPGTRASLRTELEGFVPDERDLLLGPDPVVIPLLRRPILSGRLLDPDGGLARPPGQVTLELVDGTGARVRRTAGVAEDGTWIARDLLPGRLVELEARAKGFAPVREEVELELSPGDHESIDLHLERGAVVRGVVVDQETGQPIAGAEVWTEAISFDPESPRPTTLSDAGGRFELRGVVVRELDHELAQGRVAVHLAAAASGYASETMRGILAEPRADGSCWAVVEVQPARTRIEGRVLRADGSVPEHARVFTVDARRNFGQLRPDAQGRFTLEDVPEGSLSLYAVEHRPGPRTVGQVQSEVTVAVGVQEVELVLDARADATVEGRMVDPDGAPLVDETVVLRTVFRAPNLSLNLGESRARTGADGAFRFEELLPGRYRLDIPGGDDPERILADPDEFDLDPGESHRDLVLVAARPIAVSGWVDLGGRHPGDFTVALTDADSGRDLARTEPGQDGAFRFQQVFPHRLELVLRRGDRDIDRRTIDPADAGAIVLVATD